MSEADLGVGPLFWLTHEAIVGADLETERVVLWNPSAERIFGYTADEAIGMPLERLVPEALVDAHHAGIARYRADASPHLVGAPPIEVPAVRRDGTPLAISLTLTAVEETGKRRHVVAVIRDVTAPRAAEDERQRMLDSMRAFVATASHDLRTPLTTVIGFARILVEAGDEIAGPQRTEYAGLILQAGQRASRLVDDLLTLSKIQAGVVDVRPATVLVASLAGETVAEAKVVAEVDIPTTISVFADKDHLQRMLANLVLNASKYGQPPIRLSAVDNGEYVELRVCDRGPGVPADFVASLFEPFSRADTARPQPGTGLGLSIVKGLAEANGGAIRYDAGELVGACFTLTLPKSRS